MANDDKDDTSELSGLIALYSLCCYALRELASLGPPCDEAEAAFVAAQDALRARMAAVNPEQLNVDQDPEALLH